MAKRERVADGYLSGWAGHVHSVVGYVGYTVWGQVPLNFYKPRTARSTFIQLCVAYSKNTCKKVLDVCRKRPNGESGGPTTMLIGCRFLEHENGEAEEETGAFC